MHIQGNIHAGEVEGKEATLALLRELALRLGASLQPVTAKAVPQSAAEPDSESAARGADSDAPIVSRLSGHVKLGRIVARFVEQLPAKLALMEAAATGADWVELAQLAHWLKGAGGSMGFDCLFEPARKLEDAAKSADAAGATQLLAELNILSRRIGAGVPIAELAEAGA